jgi:hypothetical protein
VTVALSVVLLVVVVWALLLGHALRESSRRSPVVEGSSGGVVVNLTPTTIDRAALGAALGAALTPCGQRACGLCESERETLPAPEPLEPEEVRREVRTLLGRTSGRHYHNAADVCDESADMLRTGELTGGYAARVAAAIAKRRRKAARGFGWVHERRSATTPPPWCGDPRGCDPEQCDDCAPTGGAA